MSKKRINLTIDEDLLNEARQHGINLSSFLEMKLREYLALIKGLQQCGRRDSNPGIELGRLTS